MITKYSEQKDVDAAGELLQDHITKGTANNFSVLVINMGDSSFNSWPEITVMWMISTDDTEPTAEYVSRFVCGSPTTTTTTQSTASTTKPTPSSSTTTSSLNTTNSGTTTAFPPTPTSVEKFNSGCECVPKTIWLDVFLLMEAGVSMTSNGIASATDYIVSAFGKLTVGQADQFQTRLGVIRYASSVDLIADLDVYTSKAQLFDLEIQPLNETGTNIDGAIRLARARFSSPTHRRAARKVIIIVGSTYTQTVYEDPTRVANEFRSEGGIIITIEYLQGTETSTPMFKQLASPNYSLINFENGKQLRAQELRQLLCKANCFCKRNWIPYSKDKWSTPQGGCYLPVTISSTQRIKK
uniref:von Willebrand factor domain containing protein n=1 Tax=Haemonchus contortus TaxID=6289 RepID=W6NWG2_HAECO